MKIRKRLVFRLVLFTCGTIIGVPCLLFIGLMLWSRIVPCSNNLPVSFTIDVTGKSGKQIAEEVVSRYLDQSVFPRSCPAKWILQYKIHAIDGAYPAWAISYEISPFPGNDYTGFYLLNGNLSTFRI